MLALAIALGALLTVLMLYFLGRHHFLSIRPATHVVEFDQLPQTKAGVSWILDQVFSGSHRLRVATGAIYFRAPATAPLILRGWVVDSEAHAPVLGVIVRTDFRQPFRAVYGISRPDVAALVCSACTASGVQIDFGQTAIPLGKHKLWLTAVRADASALYVAPAPIVFRITR